jgi:ubiquinone/menaquinone biosynthesis C-methylase UbiE
VGVAWSSPDAYERGRPGWPLELVALALGACSVPQGPVVVDLAAGTGKLSRELAPLAGRLVCVEPSAPMRSRLEREVPSAEVVDARTESLPFRDGFADVAFAAEAFHWFCSAEAVAEIARVVRAGGALVLLWQRPADLGRLEFPADTGTRKNAYDDGTWREALDASPLFGDLETASAEHVQSLDRDGVVALAASWSWIERMSDSDRRHFLASVASSTPDEVSITWRADAWWCRRL